MTALARLLSRINARISLFALLAAGIGLIAMTAIVAWTVFGRYVLNATPTWGEPVSLFLSRGLADTHFPFPSQIPGRTAAPVARCGARDEYRSQGPGKVSHPRVAKSEVLEEGSAFDHLATLVAFHTAIANSESSRPNFR